MALIEATIVVVVVVNVVVVVVNIRLWPCLLLLITLRAIIIKGGK